MAISGELYAAGRSKLTIIAGALRRHYLLALL
jgi:hypothetical protein